VDNPSIARVFGEIADLLEIRGDNAFKIRAYRSAADSIAVFPDPVARMDDRQLKDLPGIGKDLAAKIHELGETGACQFHQELLQQFPPTILDLLRLQGVGPKTVALLYSTLNIRSVEELAAAAREGRLRELKGMGAKKEALILKAVEERVQDAGRHLLADTSAVAAEIVGYLRDRAPLIDFVPVGSLRRGCETCGDLDVLAAGAPPTIMQAFTNYSLVERVLARGDTKSSVLLWGGFQADLRLVPRESVGAALQYFTGAKAHNIVLRDRAIQRGMKLNEYGLYRNDDGTLVAADSEEAIYEALGLAFVPPELRENRGEIGAAEERRLPHLVTLQDIRGDLHMHTTATDGRADAETMARAARAAGLGYIAITDHSKSLAMAGGLDEHAALEHARRVRALNGRDDLGGLTVLAGIECDIRPDGTMDLADDCLAQLDIVIASVHSAFNQDAAQMTDRLLRAIACPWVDVVGHPTGRLILRREGYALNFEQVVAAAAQAGVGLEINSQIDRLDLDDTHARLARERGIPIVIDSDAHSPAALGNLRWGVVTARRAWLEPRDILNTRSIDEFKAALRRNRQ
jgi:DNA polymerase (family X)